MAYKVNPTGVTRDKAYPSQIAAERPFGATRIHCDIGAPDELAEEALRGGEYPMHTETPCDRFNRELREGLGNGELHGRAGTGLRRGSR